MRIWWFKNHFKDILAVYNFYVDTKIIWSLFLNLPIMTSESCIFDMRNNTPQFSFKNFIFFYLLPCKPGCWTARRGWTERWASMLCLIGWPWRAGSNCGSCLMLRPRTGWPWRIRSIGSGSCSGPGHTGAHSSGGDQQCTSTSWGWDWGSQLELRWMDIMLRLWNLNRGDPGQKFILVSLLLYLRNKLSN